jgi:hypothetical protein
MEPRNYRPILKADQAMTKRMKGVNFMRGFLSPGHTCDGPEVVVASGGACTVLVGVDPVFVVLTHVGINCGVCPYIVVAVWQTMAHTDNTSAQILLEVESSTVEQM